jgi:hypothetical protein
MQYAPAAQVQPHEPFGRQQAKMPSGKQLCLHMQRPPLLPVFPVLPPLPARGVLVLPLRPPPSEALERPAAGALVEPSATPVPATTATAPAPPTAAALAPAGATHGKHIE